MADIQSNSDNNLLNRPLQPQPAKSFFGHLNYDVRLEIYSFLDLPPSCSNKATKKKKISGFVLSCRQAYFEVSLASAKRVWKTLRLVKSRVESKFDQTLIIPDVSQVCQFQQLRNITLGVPYTKPLPLEFFPVATVTRFFNRNLHDEGLASMLRPLLNMHLDSLRVIFYGGPEHAGHSDEDKRLWFESRLMDAMCCICAMIREGGSLGHKPPAQDVMTAKIALAWDLRTAVGPSGKAKLLGKVTQFKESGLIYWGNIILDSPQFYWLHTEDHMVGEMTLVSQHRWKNETSIQALLSNSQTYEFEDHECIFCCWSEGVGTCIRKGLSQAEKEAFLASSWRYRLAELKKEGRA